jgi:Ser/Thr protein kinase RdoA (MazF antagonist)
LFALAVAAAERARLDPAQSVALLRGYNTATIVVKRGALTAAELDALRAFAAARKFDLVSAPGLRPDETNRYNVLSDATFSRAFEH